MDHLAQLIARRCGARTARRGRRIQSVWSGYGELLRYHLTGGPMDSVVVKSVCPPDREGFAHRRKLRSYDVELAWYRDHASSLDDSCRIPQCFYAEARGGRWLFVLEDLDAAGFTVRTRDPSDAGLFACARWLARFHARFLQTPPDGVWPTGTYWHLATRPDELAAMAEGPLRDGANAIAGRLAQAQWQTWVHGDAKPVNFCFTESGGAVAGVDFQYLGGGVGVSDLAYLLAGCDASTTGRGQEVYFDALRRALAQRRDFEPAVDIDAVEREWRALYDWAWADYERFIAGWAPGRRSLGHEQARVKAVLNKLVARR